MSKNLFEYMAGLLAEGIDPLEHQEDIWKRYGSETTVMVVDSTGFSRVSKAHGILHYLIRLMQMRELTKPIFQAHGCPSPDYHADNVFAVFSSVELALDCALAIHQALEDAHIPLTEGEHFRVCVGIGHGLMLHSETLEGYFSEEMNFASKLGEDTAEGGETLLTNSAYQSLPEVRKASFEARLIEISGMELDYFRHKD